MSVYFCVFKLRLINGLQYRAAALAGISTQFFWGFMYIMIFEAFYKATTKTMPMTFSQTVTYIWLQQAFLAFIMLWLRDHELFNMITKGNIAYELVRPCHLYGFWYAKLISQRLSSGVLRCFPILFVALLMPYPYKIMIPNNFLTILLFIISLVLGLLILVSISMYIYISVFITMSPVGSTLVIGSIGEFCSGLIIPLPFMPQWLQNIMNVLPFRLAADLPFRIYNQNIPAQDALKGIFIQVIWLGILVILGNYSMKKIQRKVIVQGG